MENLQKIQIISTKMLEHEGKKFRVYETVTKQGKRLTVKFTQACLADMVAEGLGEINEPCVIFSSDCNLDTSRQYPCLWVRKVEKIEATERKSQDLSEIL